MLSPLFPNGHMPDLIQFISISTPYIISLWHTYALWINLHLYLNGWRWYFPSWRDYHIINLIYPMHGFPMTASDSSWKGQQHTPTLDEASNISTRSRGPSPSIQVPTLGIVYLWMVSSFSWQSTSSIYILVMTWSSSKNNAYNVIPKQAINSRLN